MQVCNKETEQLFPYNNKLKAIDIPLLQNHFLFPEFKESGLFPLRTQKKFYSFLSHTKQPMFHRDHFSHPPPSFLHKQPQLTHTTTADSDFGQKMSTTGEIPIHTAPTNPPPKRHPKARYYARRVRESLTTRVSKFFCSIFLTLLLVVGIVAFILWLSLQPHRPRFRVTSFSFPALAQNNGYDNAEITFNVSIRNSNQNIGIYYGSMDCALYFQDQRIGGTPLPLPTSFPYYQNPKTTTWIKGTLNVPTTLVITDEKWTALMAAQATGTVSFRLDLTSTIQFKIAAWSSKHHKMHASCPVSVGQNGTILPVSKDKRCPLYFS